MPLPYEVESLDDVPEAARELYEENEGRYRLPVEGVEPESEVAGLRSALEKIKRERNQLREKAGRVTDEDLEELEKLRQAAREKEEKKAEQEGRLDELRERWKQETAEAVAEREKLIERKDAVIRDLAITSQLQAAIADAGVLEEFRRSAQLEILDEHETSVEEVNGRPQGVVVDEVHGNKPITEFIAEWSKSDHAKKFMPPPTGGGGGTGQDGKPVTTDKKWSEMTMDEKAAYTASKYADVG